MVPPTSRRPQLYCNDHRPQLERDNPKAGKAEIQKLLSTAWTAAPEEEKAIYEAAKKVRCSAESRGFPHVWQPALRLRRGMHAAFREGSKLKRHPQAVHALT
jgi:hypothetical protein